MYQHILITLENSPTDRTIIAHIKQLAKALGSHCDLLHVATGVPAQFYGSGAAGEEVEEDKSYLDGVMKEFVDAGIPTTSHLAYGDPAKQIIQWASEHPCDLIAMSTHGHKFVADLVYGQTASTVRHSVMIPVLLLRSK